MSAVVFVGPTISAEEVRAVLDAVCLPPVAQGDVYRVAQRRPRCIGIVDGYFHGVPAVWHKEILWAMAEGIPVFGSASMGALRAAELDAFGMRGVGRIFEDYRDGALEDDDEVAVVHAPAEAGFTPLSEPMVNIRATLDAARDRCRIGAAAAAALARLGKAMPFEERHWAGLMERARAEGLPGAELEALQGWLPEGRVDLKRRDALAMLEAMRRELEAGMAAETVGYDFEWTDMWEQVTARWSTTAGDLDAGLGLETDLILDELRLADQAFHEAKRHAVLRCLALREAGRRGLAVESRAHRDKLTEHRSRQGLYSRAQLLDWLARNRMDAAQFEDLLLDELRVEAASRFAGAVLSEALIARLRLSGDFAGLAERARRKHETLTQAGCPHPDSGETGMTPIELVDWHFAQRLGRPMPEDLDGYVEGLGLASRADFYRLLAREYVYLTHNQE